VSEQEGPRRPLGQPADAWRLLERSRQRMAQRLTDILAIGGRVASQQKRERDRPYRLGRSV